MHGTSPFCSLVLHEVTGVWVRSRRENLTDSQLGRGRRSHRAKGRRDSAPPTDRGVGLGGLRAHIHGHTHTWSHTHVHVQTHLYTRTHTYTHAHAYTTSTSVLIKQSNTHASVCVLESVRIHTYSAEA